MYTCVCLCEIESFTPADACCIINFVIHRRVTLGDLVSFLKMQKRGWGEREGEKTLDNNHHTSWKLFFEPVRKTSLFPSESEAKTNLIISTVTVTVPVVVRTAEAIKYRYKFRNGREKVRASYCM